MSSNDIERARQLEIAVESAVGGLSREEWLELSRQGGGAADADESLARAAAAIELARQPRLEPMPRHVAVAVAAAADRYFAPRRVALLPPPAQSRPAWFVYGGWIAAAASFVAAVGLVLLDRPAAQTAARGPTSAAVNDAASAAAAVSSGAAVDVTAGGPGFNRASGTTARSADGAAAASRGAFAGGDASPDGVVDDSELGARRQALASQRFVLQRNWAPAGDPVGRQVSGDVVWDARTQTGYMRFVGLPRNAASSEQYQLWIFDGRRDERYPVDGGVFDVGGAGAGPGAELIVPIRARLPVGSPLAFAVTIERRGGVVVSDRSRLVVIARVG